MNENKTRKINKLTSLQFILKLHVLEIKFTKEFFISKNE